jgi:ABC-type polysaccharide/polyol phosphate transport system ATPase subunit
MADPMVKVSALSKSYRFYVTRHQALKELLLWWGRGRWEEIKALEDVSFSIPAGQVLGVIGRNGSGKSTLLKLLAGILSPDSGEIEVGGRICSLIELGAGFVPEYTGRENVYLYGALLGMDRARVEERFQQIVEFSELESFIDAQVKNYSSGMYMRLGFAVAVHLDPQILLLDEVLAVGDAAFQQKCFAHMESLRARGCTIILVSHDLEAVRNFCERVIWLDHGHVAADGDPALAIQAYFEGLASYDHAREGQPGGSGPLGGEVRIHAARYLNADCSETRSVESGQPLTIEVTCESQYAVAALEGIVTVFRNDGTRCLDASLGTAEGLRGLEPGATRISLTFPRFSLLAGAYEITIALRDPVQSRILDSHERQYPFVVRGRAGGGGIVDLEHSWRVERSDTNATAARATKRRYRRSGRRQGQP